MAFSFRQQPANGKSAGSAVASVTATNGSTATLAGATLLVVVMGTSFSSTTAVSCTDSAGNTYTLRLHTAFSATDFLGIFEADLCLPVAATTGTWTVSTTSTTHPADWQIMVIEATPDGSSGGAFDVGAISAIGSGSIPSSGATGTVAGGKEYVFALAYTRFTSGFSETGPSAPWVTRTGDTNTIGGQTLSGSPYDQSVSPGSGTYTGNGYSASSGNILAAAQLVLVVKEIAATDRTVNAKASIQNTTNQTETGKARLTVTTNQTITGVARVPNATTQAITGVATVFGARTDRTVTGKGNLLVTTTRTVTGKASLNNKSDRLITGKAFIFPLASQVANTLAGVSGPVVIQYTAEWRDNGFRLIQNLTPAFLGGTIDLDNDQSVARTCQLQFDGEQLPANWSQTAPPQFCVAVWANLLVGSTLAPFSLGLFALDKPQRTQASGGREIWDVKGADITMFLSSRLTTAPYTAAGGANIVNLVQQICDAQGLMRSIPASTATLAVSITWPAQTSWLEIANDLLFGINYYPLWATNQGVLTSAPRHDPYTSTTAVSYSANAEPRMVVEPFVRTTDTTIEDNIAVVAVDDPNRTPTGAVAGTGLFSSTRTNADSTSQVSTTSSGRQQLLDIRGGSKPSTKAVPDLNTANQIAIQELREAAARSLPATLLTLLDPRRTNREFYALTIDAREQNSRWRVKHWRYPIDAGPHPSGPTVAGVTTMQPSGSSRGGTKNAMQHDLEQALPVNVT